MNINKRGQHSAAASVLGYLYQVRYALLESLRRLRKEQEFIVTIETLDDVVFEQDGAAPELLQTKHHLNKAADLTDSSPDLWKTLRIWCEALSSGDVHEGTLYFLITTAQAIDGHSTVYLKPGESRNIDNAMERLNSTADSSTNQTNKKAYQSYRSLSLYQKKKLLQNIFVIDTAPHISSLDVEFKEELFHAVENRFLGSFLQRLEGWWYRRVIKHLRDRNAEPILSNELEAENISLREQFKQESLPIDDDIISASVDASGYQDRHFVHQLRLIEIGENRIYSAIKNFFRASEQRSRWVREELLHVGELGRYEDRLIEEWEILFQQIKDELDKDASEEVKKTEAQKLYKLIETVTQLQIRPGVFELSITRGTYQILSDAQRVGWHLEFKERLRQLFENREATS